MDDEQIQAIRERVKALPTEHAWYVEDGPENRIYEKRTDRGIAKPTHPSPVAREVIAEFIAHAREDIPALLAEVERLRKVIDDTQEFIVLHHFDTSSGRRIAEYIAERMSAT